MQTFLPYPEFERSARILDWRRLGKQRVEALQILRALRRGSGGWTNHPAVRMWAGHEGSLCLYLQAMVDEWVGRGYRNTIDVEEWLDCGKPSAPPWLGDPDFHASHRSNLLRKDPVHYGRLGWSEPDNLPYVWPVPPYQ